MAKKKNKKREREIIILVLPYPVEQEQARPKFSAKKEANDKQSEKRAVDELFVMLFGETPDAKNKASISFGEKLQELKNPYMDLGNSLRDIDPFQSF